MQASIVSHYGFQEEMRLKASLHQGLTSILPAQLDTSLRCLEVVSHIDDRIGGNLDAVFTRE